MKFLLLFQLVVFGCVFQIAEETDPELEEPFLLPFGPKQGDSFITKMHGSSEEQDLAYSFRFGSQRYNSVFICTLGYLSFGESFVALTQYTFDTLSYVLIAPYWANVYLYDNLIDSMCLELDTDNNAAYSYFETICWHYQDEQVDTIQQTLNSEDVTDENLRSLVEEWSNKTFPRDNFNVTSDDDIARAVFGNDTTKYVNLANNVFKRQLSDEVDLQKASDVVVSCMGNGLSFHATWGFVATWYKVGMGWKVLNAFNSYQTIITCDDKKTSLNSDDECFVIFDFYELQWSRNDEFPFQGRSGLKASDGFYYELPSSGTAEVRNLWAESNCNIGGIWVFELDQTGTRDAILLPTVAPPQYKKSDLCSGRIKPKYVKSYGSKIGYKITDCVLPEHKELNMKFAGANCRKIKPASFDQNTNTIEGYYPDNWGIHEDVDVTLIIDGIEVEGSWNTVFSSPYNKKPSRKISASVSGDGRQATLRLPSSFADETSTDLQVFTGTGSDDGCLKTETTNEVLQTGSTSVDASLEPYALFTVFSMTEQSTDTTLWTPPIVGESNLTCESWLEKDLKRDLSNCMKDLGKWFGCPRTSSPERFGIELTDVWFAHEEVRGGLSGWQYDICCNQNDSTTRDELNDIGYCSNITCEFNPGAYFCIRSPRLACLENDKVVYVTNKCCYDSKNLLNETREGAGSLNLEVNAVYNLEPHYRSDIEPYKACCVKSSKELCDLYQSRRPPITGIYWTRIILFGRGDPHIDTIDGANYSFMGLGVYTMLETTSGGDTKMQVSTRRVGNGTVFSGFVVKNEGKSLEGYIDESGTFKVTLDNAVLELGLLPEYTLNGVSVIESIDKKEWTFEFVDVKMIVKVIVTGSYLNLMVSVPPTFHSRIKGLLGFYDGNINNDFTTADGAVLSPDVDLQTLHDQFGESYTVGKSEWLFQDEENKASIESDIQKGSPYVASYVIEFGSDEEYNSAVMACANDIACIRDISLTADFSFATHFKELEQKVKDSAFFSELHRLNAPDPDSFREKEEETSDVPSVKHHLSKCLLIGIFVMTISVLV